VQKSQAGKKAEERPTGQKESREKTGTPETRQVQAMRREASNNKKRMKERSRKNEKGQRRKI